MGRTIDKLIEPFPVGIRKNVIREKIHCGQKWYLIRFVEEKFGR